MHRLCDRNTNQVKTLRPPKLLVKKQYLSFVLVLPRLHIFIRAP